MSALKHIEIVSGGVARTRCGFQITSMSVAAESTDEATCIPCLIAECRRVNGSFSADRDDAAAAIQRLFKIQVAETERLRAEVGRFSSALAARDMDPRPLPKVDEMTQRWLEISAGWKNEPVPDGTPVVVLARVPGENMSYANQTFLSIARILKNLVDRLEGKS